MHQQPVETTDGKTKVVKADRNLFKRLLVASTSGRKVDLKGILSHELHSVPMSLANDDGSLRSCDNKSQLLHDLSDNVVQSSLQTKQSETCVVIDAMAE